MSHEPTECTERTYNHTCMQSSMPLQTEFHTEIALLAEIIEAVSSDNFTPSSGFRPAAANYLAARVRALAVELMEEGVGTLHPPPLQRWGR